MGKRSSSSVVSSEEVVRKALEFHGSLGGSPPPKLPTGFPCVDDVVGGICPGELVIVAARPNVGKSTAGLFMARTMEQAGFRPGFISLEDSPVVMGERIQTFESRVAAHRLRSGEEIEDPEELLRKAKLMTTCYSFPIGGSPDEVVMCMRDLVHSSGVDVVFVDYFTAVEVTGELRGAYSSLANRLKGTASKLGVPLVLICQIRRARWDDNRSMYIEEPELWDLAETSFLERKAEIVLMFWRERADTFGKMAKLKYARRKVDLKFQVLYDENTGLIRTQEV